MAGAFLRARVGEIEQQLRAAEPAHFSLFRQMQWGLRRSGQAFRAWLVPASSIAGTG